MIMLTFFKITQAAKEEKEQQQERKKGAFMGPLLVQVGDSSGGGGDGKKQANWIHTLQVELGQDLDVEEVRKNFKKIKSKFLSYAIY